jgi:L-fucose isomerase-like protein
MGWFADVCRVVKGMKRARIGCIGERTTPFKTVRFSEKLLEASGISVETMSLMDIVSKVTALPDSDQRVKAKVEKLSRYLPGSEQVPARSLATSAKLGVALEEWAQDCGIHAYAIQCWSAMQEALQIFPCAMMSMMSDELLPSACEADVMGAVAMYALQLAGEGPTALFDWNNNYDEDPDKLILFHCSNTALSFMKEAAAGLNRMALKSNPRDSCYCTLTGSLKPGPVAFARLATDDTRGRIIGYIGDGEVTTDTLSTFGTTGVVKVPQLPKLLSFMAFHGFEHHVALSYSPRTRALREALTRYLGWKIYCHNGEDRSILEQW